MANPFAILALGDLAQRGMNAFGERRQRSREAEEQARQDQILFDTISKSPDLSPVIQRLGVTDPASLRAVLESGQALGQSVSALTPEAPKPQSPQGKIAADAGLQVGTPEFQQFVQERSPVEQEQLAGQEIDDLLRRADEFEAAGDRRRAALFRSRAETVAGVQPTADGARSTQGKILEDMGFQPGTEAFRREMTKLLQSESRVNQRQQRIDAQVPRLMRELGVAEDEAIELATNVVDKLVRFEMTETGAVRMIDEGLGKAYEIPVRIAEGIQAAAGESDIRPPPNVEDPNNVTAFQALEYGTGLVNRILDVGSAVTGQFGLPIAEDQVFATQRLNSLGQEFIRNLSLNPRFPAAEQDRIRKELTTLPSFFESVPRAQGKLLAIHNDIAEKLIAARRDAQDPSLGADIRSAQQANANALEAFLPKLGLPPDFTARVGGRTIRPMKVDGAAETALPEGIPEGSEQVSELNGKPVYRSPDGQLWTVE